MTASAARSVLDFVGVTAELDDRAVGEELIGTLVVRWIGGQANRWSDHRHRALPRCVRTAATFRVFRELPRLSGRAAHADKSEDSTQCEAAIAWPPAGSITSPSGPAKILLLIGRHDVIRAQRERPQLRYRMVAICRGW